MLRGVTHATVRKQYGDLQQSIEDWGAGRDEVPDAGDKGAGPSLEVGLANRIRARREAAAAEVGHGSDASGSTDRGSGDGPSLFEEAVGDYRGEVLETQRWAVHHGITPEELPDRVQVLASIQVCSCARKPLDLCRGLCDGDGEHRSVSMVACREWTNGGSRRKRPWRSARVQT